MRGVAWRGGAGRCCVLKGRYSAGYGVIYYCLLDGRDGLRLRRPRRRRRRRPGPAAIAGLARACRLSLPPVPARTFPLSTTRPRGGWSRVEGNRTA